MQDLFRSSVCSVARSHLHSSSQSTLLSPSIPLHPSTLILLLHVLAQGASLDAISGSHYRTFFWHSLGHWLGLDTHDTSLMAYDRPLKRGSCITIEPGLYIPDEPQYGALRGIGVRIEDDVAVTDSGCEVLSRDVPVDPKEIEALVGARGLWQ